MPAVDLVVRSVPSRTIRARQASSMFDMPEATEQVLEWKGSVPIEDRPWSVGLIVGPSGAGKSSVMRQMFGDMPELHWQGASMLDDFRKDLKLDQITDACSAVGFNTIPAWLRPFHVLSNGERFRADLARRLVELPDPVVVDEFTSVVDRQVAKIGSHAVQKYARKHGRKFVAVTCHYDVIDWLQPDWILEPVEMKFQWRSVQSRPKLNAWVQRVPYSLWSRFAPYHYLTADLHRAARCFALFVEGVGPIAFNGVMHFPHPKVDDIMSSSRTVTLPDWQGVGAAMIMTEVIASAYKAVGKRYHKHPAHPPFIRTFDRSPMWKLVGKPMSSQRGSKTQGEGRQSIGGRPCATFCYIGPAMEIGAARALLGG